MCKVNVILHPSQTLSYRLFQNREVDVQSKHSKTLVQRTSRIPVIQSRPTTPRYHAASSSQVARHYEETLASQSISDWCRGGRYEGPVVQEDHRPRGLPAVSHEWAPIQQPTSPELDYGRQREQSSSPLRHHHRNSMSSTPRNPTPSTSGHNHRSSPDAIPSTSGRTRPARPSSPASGSKRAHSPAEDLCPSQAQKLNDHQGRARAKDYDSMTQEIVSMAVTYFRCLLATEDTFPDHTSETHLLTLTWTMARQEHKLAMDMTLDIAKLITSRTSQMRGELKTKVRVLVKLTFSFESDQNKCNVRKNHQLAEDLKEGMGYAYKTSPSKADSRKGLYKAPLIQKSLNVMWFANCRSEGATYPEMFGPILHKPTLALVLTAIECGIDEWATGIKADVPFTSADYRSVYIDHIKAMTDFETRSAPRDILGNILTRLHNIGRFHSGAQPLIATAPATWRLTK
ncbi:hypothetical protein B0H14DRAFT_2629001 [Mycena olivaceomarginata]|nr:hypothetical protein B0H14DRAFT_2629001 [Mycena olivaceomarginata]